MASAEGGEPTGEGLGGEDEVLEEKLESARWEERPGLLLPQCSPQAWTVPGMSDLQALPCASGGVLLVRPSKISRILQDSLCKSGSSSSLLQGLEAWLFFPRVSKGSGVGASPGTPGTWCPSSVHSRCPKPGVELNCRAEVQSILFTCQPQTAPVISFTDTESRPLQAPEVTPLYGVCKSSLL